MSKILANQIANYLDNAPIEIKEGLNIPTGKPLQVNGSIGTNGQVLSTDGSGLVWANAPYFDGDYNNLTNRPTIPAAQVNSDWNVGPGDVRHILNKPVVPPQPSVTTAPAPSGLGSLTYNTSNGEFTFTQPDLSSYIQTETDPVFLASDAAAVTAAKIANWDTSFSWGNHAAQGYITPTGINVSQLSASGGGSLAYDNGTGTLTYRPPDLSGYLTAESDTLATVTARGAVTTANVTVNDMVVNGNLTVIGTTTSNNQATLNVSATEIVINDGQSGAPTLNGSLKIDRGSATDTAIRWNEGTDIWEFTNDGTTYNPIPTNTNQLTNGAGFLTSYTETDPVFSGSPAGSITNTNVTNWNTAYGWGDHAGAGYLTAEADTLDTITSRGNTTNNGIQVGGLTVNGNMTVNGTQTVINTAILQVSDNEITLNNDVTGTPTENAGIEVERGLSTNVRIRWDETADRWQFTNNGSNYYNIPTQISDLANDSGYITTFVETDPIFTASPASAITTTELGQWNAAYNWGDHATAGYLTAYTETDPVFSASEAASITSTDTTNWDSAFGWGDHSTAGYLTSYTEADTLATVTGRGATTSTQIISSGGFGVGQSNGSGNLTLTQDGTQNSVISHLGTGSLTLKTNNNNGILIWADDTGSDIILRRGTGVGVVNRLATTSTGVTFTGDIELGSGDLTTTGKLYYSNNFATTGDLPNATTYHGMFAHVHAEGHGYFAHAGAWTQLIDTGSSLSELADVSATAPSTNDVLTWDGSNWGPAAPTGGSGGASVTSVNSETGIVNLGIQDMNDFSLRYTQGASAGTAVYQAGVYSTTCGGAKWSVPASNRICLQRYSAGNFDMQSLWTTIIGNPTGYAIELRNGTTGGAGSLIIYAQITSAVSDGNGGIIITHDGSYGPFLEGDDPPGTGNFSGYVYFDFIGSVPTQLADGDILQYVSTDSLFKPTSLSINSLSDVDTSTVAPTDGQALVWDNAAGKWEPGTISGGSGSGIELTDLSVTTDSPDTAALSYNSSNGVFTFTPPDLSGYAETANLNTSNWDTAYGWGDHAQAGYLSSYSEGSTLQDVTARGATSNVSITLSNILYVNSQIHVNSSLRFDHQGGQSTFGNVAGGGGVTVRCGQARQIDFTNENGTVTFASLSDSGGLTAGGLTYPTTNGTNGQVLTSDGAGNVTWSTVSGGGATTLGGLTDVDTTTVPPSGGEVLYYDASNTSWLPIPYQLGSLNGVDLTTTPPTNGQTLVYNSSNNLWEPGSAGGGGSSLQSRTTSFATTAVIANDASADITIVAEKTYVLHKIQTSVAAWVTLYTDTSSRTNDASRTENTDPTPGSGVIAEVITTTGTTQPITPGTIGWNNDGTPSRNAYLKVVNKSGSSTSITVTLHYVQLEA